MMKRSTIWWLVGVITMLSGLLLGVTRVISEAGQYFMVVMGFLATINSNVLFIEEKLK